MGLSRRALVLTAAGTPFARAAEPSEIICPLVQAPKLLIPGISREAATQLLGAKIYRGLMRWGTGGGLEPDLAGAVEVSPDGLTYVFHLRPGVTWHDSGGFSASDVVFSIGRFHRALQPAARLDRVTAEAPDRVTVVLTLARPDPGFLRQLTALCLPVVPEHVHDCPGWALDPRKTIPVGTGPFRVSDWLRLERFEWFAGPKPALSAIQCPILPDPAARIALAESGQAVLLAGEAADLSVVARLRTVASLAVEGETSPASLAMAGLRLNHAVKPLDQPEVRVGLACAIDRRAVLRDAWAGLGRVATGPLAAGSINRNEAALLPPYDPRAAASRFDAAGLRPDDAGLRAQLRFLLPPGAPWQGLFATVRRSLGQVAIDLAAEPVSAADWARRVEAGEYQVSGFAASQTGDPALDLLDYAAHLPKLDAVSAEQQRQLQAQVLLIETMPCLWLVEPAFPVVRAKRLRLPDGALGSLAQASLA